MSKKLTVKQLQQAWTDFFKVAVYQNLRFGQYLFNEYDFEVLDSYTNTDNNATYRMVFNSLTLSVGGKK